MDAFDVAPARYAKGKLIVRPRDARGVYKGRASYLIDNLAARWTGREGGYVMSPLAVDHLRLLHRAGFDGCMTFGGEQGAFRRVDAPFSERLPLAAALRLARTVQ